MPFDLPRALISSNHSGGYRDDSDVRSCNDQASWNMITFIPTLHGLNSMTIQCTCTNSVGKGCFIMSENTNEKRHGTVLLLVELGMVEDFAQADEIRAATFGRKVI